VHPRALPHCPRRVHVLPSISLRRNPWVEPVEIGSGETTYYTLHTTDGRQAVVPVPPGQDRWLIAVRYVREYFPSSDFLADLTPATPAEIAAFQAEHPHVYLDWLARDS